MKLGVFRAFFLCMLILRMFFMFTFGMLFVMLIMIFVNQACA